MLFLTGITPHGSPLLFLAEQRALFGSWALQNPVFLDTIVLLQAEPDLDVPLQTILFWADTVIDTKQMIIINNFFMIDVLVLY